MNYMVCVCVALLCVGATVLAGEMKCSAENLHPVIFFPGVFGTRIEEKFDIPSTVPMPHSSCARKSSDDWEGAWVEWKKILPLSQFDCLSARFAMVPNEAGDHWNNTPGTEFHVVKFGSVESIDPLSYELGNVIRMYGHAMDDLKDIGFVDSQTLFAASYDWRVMPTEQWKNDVRELIENAVKTTGKKAVLFSHSMGCAFSYIFLMSQTAEWRQQYVYHYVPVSPVWIGTGIIPFTMATNKIFNFTLAPFTALGALFRHLEALYVLSPSIFYNPDTLVATTDQYIYTAKNFSMLLERVGIKRAEAITRNVQQQLCKYDFEHPGIPVTTLFSTGAKTLGAFHWAKDSQVGVIEPVPDIIEGDGLVPHDSLTFAYKLWSNGPHADITEGIPIPGSNHASASREPQTIETIYKIACETA